MGLLITVAGIVTPLGLYQVLVAGPVTQAPFDNLVDNSSFGYGTPPRSSLPFSRICGIQFSAGGPIPCPFSDTISIVTAFPNETINYDYPYGYDTGIPENIKTIYSSGTQNRTTVSNYFDIQWRRYMTTSSGLYNNGSQYVVSAFRNMESLILNNARHGVEGLIVDSVSGGVGLRNHTFPPGFAYGVTWEEDILFIEPETVCVDTNLTLDFTITSANSSLIDKVALTDRGGFVHLNTTYPEPDVSDPQKNADLYGRAYKAAWLNNAYTAVYYNVTNPSNHSAGVHAFSYLNSEMNKTFSIGLTSTSSILGFDALTLSPKFGGYLGSTIGTTTPGLTNPYGIGSQNFSEICKSYSSLLLLQKFAMANKVAWIALVCSGAGSGDFANITNILVFCGSMQGVPQRQDPGQSGLVFEQGSNWSQKLFTCASAVKASIKRVSFVYNGTDNTLSSLGIVDIKDKAYDQSNSSSMPLWGVENTGNAYYTSDLSLIWGLVSDEYETNVNVSTVVQPHLYLPGWINPSSVSYQGFQAQGFENLPGTDFGIGALQTAYCVSADSSTCTGGIDYSGQTNMAMWVKWQNLTRSADTASLIPNLIFTDTAASAIVGTKGVLVSAGNANGANAVTLSVTPTVARVRYHYPYAIPGLLTCLLLALMTVVAIVTSLCFSRGKPIAQLRLNLQQIAPGRIYTTFLLPGQGSMTMKARDWAAHWGFVTLDLSNDFPKTADGMLPAQKEEEVTVDAGAPHTRKTSGDPSSEGEALMTETRHSAGQD